MQNFNRVIPDSPERPLLMKLRPLLLREKLFWRLYKKQANKFLCLFENASLEFAPKISLKLMPTDISHQQIAFLGFIELAVSRWIAELAKAGSLMVDVGANYGYYSCIWAAAGEQNQVIAFEVSPKNSSALKMNVTRNRLQSQVKVYEKALGKEDGSFPFTLGPDDQSGWGGLLSKGQDNQDGTVEVQVVTLDDFLAKSEHEHIDVLKIDTEGADTWVLQGAEHLLRSHKICHIFFEENTVRMSALGIQPGEAQNLLRDCGYRLEHLNSGEWYASSR